MGRRPPHVSASILNADFGRLGEEVARATAGGVDSIHLDVMDGHFVPNISFGAPVVAALRRHSALPFHAHLMIDDPLRYAADFATAGSDLIAFHVEATDDPAAVIAAILASGKQVGLALNPETPAGAVHPYLEQVDLVLVMTVHPGFGGQAFLADVLPKLHALAAEIDARGLSVPVAVDGGVNRETIRDAYAAGGEVLVIGSALYEQSGDLGPAVAGFRAAAEGGG
ncbi:MAG TPA: ribulose-phosphate 3-epimerase [Candidatus Limnocylindria bacterium]